MFNRTFAQISICILGIITFGTAARAQSNRAGSASTLPAPVQVPSTKSGTGPLTPDVGTSTSTTGNGTSVAPATIKQQYRIPSPSIGDFRMRAGIKTTETTARAYEYKMNDGRRVRHRYEYYLGAVHKSGWGGYLLGQTAGTEWAAGSRNSSAIQGGDGSFTLLHPDFYKGQSLTLSGQARRYIAVTQRSKGREQKHWAYYVYATYKMPQSFVLWNQATPRFFDQGWYKRGDTTFAFEDVTNLTKQLNQDFAIGIGQWTQVEWHSRTDTGISVDATLFARYTPIANVWIEPRLSFPAYLKNVVFDAAEKVALDNARAELYAQITL